MATTELDKTMHITPDKQYSALRDHAIESIKSHFPFNEAGRELKLERIWAEDKGSGDDISAIKRAKLSGKSWDTPIYGEVSIVDEETGKRVGHTKRMRLGRVPRMTPHYSYVVDGTEYQVGTQTRMRSGIYTRRKANGELEGHFNLAKGLNFNAKINPESGKFIMEVNKANLPMYPVLRALGATDKQIEGHWGKELVDANKTDEATSEKVSRRLHRMLIKGKEPDKYSEVQSGLIEYYNNTQMDPKSTVRTLGASFDRINSDALLKTTNKLLRISKQEADVDDRDAMPFKQILGPEDLLDERLRHWKTQSDIRFKVRRRIQNTDDPRKVIGDLFDGHMKQFFTKSDLATATEQNNPLNLISQYNRISALGEGGIGSIRAVTDDARNVNDSHLGFMGPLHTPESSKIGITMHTAIDTKKEGRSLKTKAIDAHTGKEVWVSGDDIADKVLSFSSEYDLSSSKPRALSSRVKAMNKNKMDEVPSSKVDFILPSAKGMFDIAENMVPFLDSTQGTRGMTGAKMFEQAVSLVNPEAPMVQVSYDDKRTFEGVVGEKFAASSSVGGKVTKVEDDQIVITAPNGTKHSVPLYNNYPLNQKSFLHHTPVVKVGDKVDRGQLLADSNFTKGGVLAAGVGLKVAYMPWKGYTLEDASVVSESAIKKLTSQHMHHKEAPAGDGSVFDLKKYKAYYPGRISKEMEENLDSSGIIKPGTRVRPGDVLLAQMRKEEVRPEDSILARLGKSMIKPFSNRAVEWDHDHEGVVTDVVNDGKYVKVYVRTEEPARVGDKIAGRFGNKSIIAKVLPDNEMPHTDDGNAVDVVFDPHTVTSRINPSQIMESAAGQAARKLGKPYVVKNFEKGNNLDKVKKLMTQAGLPITGKYNITDPATGKTIPNIFVGDQYIQKLKHQVEHKFASRNFESGYDIQEAPRSGVAHGAQSMDHLTLYAMLAHGGNREILKEMATDHKASRNPDLWRAVQMGEHIPSPKPTYAWQKFLGLLKGMGVNVEKKDDGMMVTPLTDQHITDMSSGAIVNPTLMIRGKDLRPESGGMFDPTVTGGLKGTQWSHIDLAKPIPNPMLAKGVQSVGGINTKQYDAIMSGRMGVDEQGNIVELRPPDDL